MRMRAQGWRRSGSRGRRSYGTDTSTPVRSCVAVACSVGERVCAFFCGAARLAASSLPLCVCLRLERAPPPLEKCMGAPLKRCAAALCVCLCVGARGAADSRFDEEPRDLVGLTVFVKDHGKGEVLDFARARIGASS